MPPLCHSAKTPDASGACEMRGWVKGTQPLLIAMVPPGAGILLLRALVAARHARVRETKFRQQLGLAPRRVARQLPAEVARIMGPRAARVVILQPRADGRVATRCAHVDRLFALPHPVPPR